MKPLLLALSRRHLLTVYQHEGEIGYSAPALLRAFYYELPGRRERQELHLRAGEYYKQEEQNCLQATRHFQLAGHS